MLKEKEKKKKRTSPHSLAYIGSLIEVIPQLQLLLVR